mgnify:CR=1 FL=1
MEFLILSSNLENQRKREMIIMQAVIEAAEILGIKRITKRRCNVLSTGVYLVNREGKKLLYNDWEKDWKRKKIYERIVSSLKFLNENNENNEIVLTIS